MSAAGHAPWVRDVRIVHEARRAFLPALTLGACALPAAAHDSPQVFDGSFDLIVLVLLVVSGLAYVHGSRGLWRTAGRGRGIRLIEAGAFSVGWLIVAAALSTPLDTLGAARFSVHMIQHELLMLAAAPLLVLGWRSSDDLGEGVRVDRLEEAMVETRRVRHLDGVAAQTVQRTGNDETPRLAFAR